MSNWFKRSVSGIAAAGLLASSLPVPGYANEVRAAASSAARERVETLFVDHGVQPAEARARAAALTDEEARLLAAEMDTLPAGGTTGFDTALWVAFIIVAASLALVATVVEAVSNEISSSRSGSARQRPGAQAAYSTEFQEH